jgi:hypothetical protein
MRILLLDAEDSPLCGPWSRERWDLIVDLGKSSQFSEERWRKRDCAVLRSDAFSEGIADAKRVREIFAVGTGRLVDEEGIDWWRLTQLRIAPDVFTALALERVAGEIKAEGELWCTRESWQARMLASLCNRPLECFGSGELSRVAVRARRYGRLFRRFSWPQIKQIFFDKYDANYRWRSQFASKPERSSQPVVLVPSAYENVSRMAAGYARLIPEQALLMIATRWSARQFEPPANMQIRNLAAYAGDSAPTELKSLLEGWARLKGDLSSVPEFRMLSQGGILESFSTWFRDGLSARNAWRDVLEREPVSGVLCGDDSNMFTRLPVLLATKRKIPTVDFHHGAFDGHCMIKDQPCDVYLAKSEMERDYLVRVCERSEDRIVIAPPGQSSMRAGWHHESSKATAVLLFSEPYEAAGLRGQEVYREILPPLIRVARDNGRRVIVKLHPFESKRQRLRMIQALFPAADCELITVLDGPLRPEILSQAWFGITIESTTVMDCWEHGISCFLCGWLARSPYGYLQQYARFGVGEELKNAGQITEIPERLAEMRRRPAGQVQSEMIDPTRFKQLLTCGIQDGCGVRLA